MDDEDLGEIVQEISVSFDHVVKSDIIDSREKYDGKI